MDIQYIKNNYKFETLSYEHDVSEFESESEDLNDFLKHDALNLQKDKFNVTKLIVCDNEIIGFVSLLTDSIPLKDIRDENLRHDIKNQLNILNKKKKLPAIKIGRLAIDKKYSNQGLGSDILMNILFNIKNIAETSVGLRFVTVDGYAKAYTFYVEHNNFVNLKKDDEKIRKKLDTIIERNPNQTFLLYLDLKKLE